jgi:hypothetical protein
MSLRNYYYRLRNDSEERSSQGRILSLLCFFYFAVESAIERVKSITLDLTRASSIQKITATSQVSF